MVHSDLADKVLRTLQAENADVQMRRQEFVGPQVGDELRDDGGLAMIIALACILVYVMARFEYRFAFDENRTKLRRIRERFLNSSLILDIMALIIGSSLLLVLVSNHYFVNYAELWEQQYYFIFQVILVIFLWLGFILKQIMHMIRKNRTEYFQSKICSYIK